eukprot:scaffold162_cov176-Amphora_coffeaeformis.AAC.12
MEPKNMGSLGVDVNRLRAEANQILADAENKITCTHATGPGDKQIFYNRIGKAGSSALISLFKRSLQKNITIHDSLTPSDRGSDEFLTRQGELELIQKIVGNPELSFMDHAKRGFLVYHSFFLNFTRYGLSSPIFINMVREPAERYASQFAFWKTLPDIGKLTKEHGSTLGVCLGGQHIGCPPLNYQTSYFCGHEPACQDPPTDASFLQAVRHVVENYAAVGTLEKLDDLKEQIVTMFPEWIILKMHGHWHKKTEPAIAARYRHKHGRSEMELDEIRAANVYDVLLYEIVEKISDTRLASCRQQRSRA